MIEVVIPAYNAGTFLGEALRSVAAQTDRPAQVTVVDDASTDNTVEVARACAAELNDRVAIRLLRNSGPRGPSAARNTAIRQSGARYIALLDADDVLAPGHHATLARLFRAEDAAVLAFADSTVFNGAATVTPSALAVSGVAAMPAREVAPGCFTLGDGMFTALLRTGVFGTSACMFRRDAALQVGLLDEAMMYGEDTDFFLRLSIVGPFLFSREVVAHKRLHGDNLSHDRNRLAFCHGMARSLARLAVEADRGGPDRGRLSPGQREALRDMLPKALEGYLYHASRASPGAYWSAAKLAKSSGHGLAAVKPRHVARLALAWALRRGRDRRAPAGAT